MIAGRIIQVLPSPSDNRDHRYRSENITLDRRVDLREWASLIEDQGDLGSCTAQALTAAYELITRIQYPDQAAKLSDLYVYYNARFFYSETLKDNGAYLRDIFKAAKRFGMCRDELWPYDITRYDKQPSPACYESGQHRTITNYEIILDQTEMLDVVNAGRPVVIGINIYEEFTHLTQEDSVVPVPAADSRLLGMHAMTVVGYDLDRRQWLAQNSYGTSWGDMGYCWIPFEYMEGQVIERWCFAISDPRIMLLS